MIVTGEVYDNLAEAKRAGAVERFGIATILRIEEHAIRLGLDDAAGGHPRRCERSDDTVWGVAYNEAFDAVRPFLS